MQLNYTFIIPHKNTPKLLKRCLTSIIQRDDLEIIVVDDNSYDVDVVKRIVSCFPRALFCSNKGFGAGGARNTAIPKAKGRWIIFADADDYFDANFLKILDIYINENVDIVYHPAQAVNAETLEPMPGMLIKHNRYFDEYSGDCKTTDQIKYRLHSPWWKMVRKDFLMEYGILFEEVPKGNDIFFSYQLGYFSKRIVVEKAPLYIHTFNRNGISYGKKNLSIRIGNLIQHYRINRFYDYIGYPEWKRNVIRLFYECFRYDSLVLFVQTIYYFVTHYKQINDASHKYVNDIRTIELKHKH